MKKVKCKFCKRNLIWKGWKATGNISFTNVLNVSEKPLNGQSWEKLFVLVDTQYILFLLFLVGTLQSNRQQIVL